MARAPRASRARGALGAGPDRRRAGRSRALRRNEAASLEPPREQLQERSLLRGERLAGLEAGLGVHHVAEGVQLVLLVARSRVRELGAERVRVGLPPRVAADERAEAVEGHGDVDGRGVLADAAVLVADLAADRAHPDVSGRTARARRGAKGSVPGTVAAVERV